MAIVVGSVIGIVVLIRRERPQSPVATTG
jgi:hypothetical protein